MKMHTVEIIARILLFLTLMFWLCLVSAATVSNMRRLEVVESGELDATCMGLYTFYAVEQYEGKLVEPDIRDWFLESCKYSLTAAGRRL
jgi:hypothetical protein